MKTYASSTRKDDRLAKHSTENRGNDSSASFAACPPLSWKPTESSISGGTRKKGFFKSSKPNLPLVSIITVVFNGDKFLKETIDSVLRQSYNNIEYIIIDGGSTDKTISIIQEYNEVVDYWLSETDKGIYDAMNKGISLANGDIIGILNSDDFYINKDCIKLVVENINDYESFLVTSTLIKTDNKSILFNCNRQPRLHFQIPFMHPSAYIPKALYIKYGLYDLQYQIASDVDMLMRLFTNSVEYKRLESVTVVMRSGGASEKNFIPARKEYCSIYIKYYHDRIKAYSGYFRSLLFYFKSCLRNMLWKV